MTDCTRRSFLEAGLALGAGLVTRSAMGPCCAASFRIPCSESVLVVLQARGGWDGLSMLVPVEDAAYHALRPELAIHKQLGLAVQGVPELRWHPEMAPLRDLFDRGELAVVQNVSHSHPDLSHSESETKWHTADPAGVVRTGWLARYLLAAGHDDPLMAVTIQDLASHSFAGVDVPAFRDLAVLSLQGDANERAAIAAVAAAHSGAQPLPDIAQAMRNALAQSEALLASGASYRPRATYPDSELGRDLQLCASLIVGNRRTRLAVVSTAGYDTHTQQCERSRPTVGGFADRLSNLCQATRAFLDDVRAHGRGDHVVMLLQSEFGRAAHENRLLGTEHGHGGIAFLAGAPVHGGLYGKAPDLAAIRADPRATSIAYAIPFDQRATDYRRIHATLLERWLGVQSEPILHGRFAPLGML